MFASEFADKPFSEVHIPGYLYFMLHRYGLVQGFSSAKLLICFAQPRVVLSTPLHILALLAAVAIECEATFSRSLTCCHN